MGVQSSVRTRLQSPSDSDSFGLQKSEAPPSPVAQRVREALETRYRRGICVGAV